MEAEEKARYISFSRTPLARYRSGKAEAAEEAMVEVAAMDQEAVKAWTQNLSSSDSQLGLDEVWNTTLTLSSRIGSSGGGKAGTSGGGSKGSSISVTSGSSRTATRSSAGGGSPVTIPAGTYFAGRNVGGGTRGAVYGGPRYYSG